jgi:ketosteroid isomerase-like protein
MASKVAKRSLNAIAAADFVDPLRQHSIRPVARSFKGGGRTARPDRVIDASACTVNAGLRNRGEWTSRLGRHDVAGKPVSWPAIAIFRFRDGKIAEEWVSRDELGMLIQLGVVGLSPAPA